MADNQQTFSESWHRVANQRIYLRSSVRVRRQYYRGERWYVLENPVSNQYFRLRPQAYEFIARLRPDKTVEQVWEESLETNPDEAPGQDAVIRLLAQLYQVGLLHYENPEDSAELFRRFQQRRQREIRSKFLNLMFIRFPLLDPDRFLKRMLPIVGPLISPFGFLIWLLTVGGALKVVLDYFPALKDESQALLAPGNLVWLYAGLVILKTLHEFGHAFFCRKFGGEVHVMGVMLMIFTPIPYVDATSSWGFSSRWKRALVGLAGMIVEVFVAALATFVWANTGAGLVHNLAYNMMFIASVSTLLFNLNPLLRFDGYYILCDLLNYPNLHQHSAGQLKHVVKRHAYGVATSKSPTDKKSEKTILVTFGILSHIYRIIVFTGILLFVADRFLLIGVVMAVICLFSWIVAPLGKWMYYLFTSPELDRVRSRAVGVTLGFVGVLLIFLQLVPLPHHFRASGVVAAENWAELVSQTEGTLMEVLVEPGAQVTAGTPLLRLSNPELSLEMRRAEARLSEVKMQLLQAMSFDGVDVKPLLFQRQSIEERILLLKQRQEDLIMKSPIDGIWVAPEIEQVIGRWLVRGSSLGRVIHPGGFEFISPVLQDDVDRLFANEIGSSEVRLFGMAEAGIEVTSMDIIPVEKRQLPSRALGWSGGGDIPVTQEDEQGATTAEPFFEVRSKLGSSGDAHLLHGRSGKIRFDLKAEPLLPRWIRRLRQLLQRRYQL
jgi:putative peptide zinc metalloprotease protein